MTPELHIITQSELANFRDSGQYKHLNEKPISCERLDSYMHNPHAKPDDIVLYMLLQDNQLIAYRTILPDDLYGKTPEHFGWCSGNWVHPEHRRKGYSNYLLKQAMQDWNGKIMYTNYAPESHALYQKTGQFTLYSHREGYGFYLYAKTRELLRNRVSSVMRFFLFFVDILVWIVAALRSLMLTPGKNRWSIEEKRNPDSDYLRMFDARQKVCFEREATDLEWILKYPWVKEKQQQQAYFFSHRAKRFFYRFIVLKDKKNTKGFAMLQYRDGCLKVPYFQLGSGGHTELAIFLVKFCKRHKIKLMTIYDPVLSEAVSMVRHPFLYKKQKFQNVYAAWKPSCRQPLVSDGDGDYVFT
ncbi:MAG: GNAT family N-acetyltransferase [Candidatus Delongbacteria bacterium]|jgi:GNAT superfamily N-acetyltransferase|nr:GNAT family N-acetyltransferase [Candidatus Delongbacteria bacterium]